MKIRLFFEDMTSMDLSLPDTHGKVVKVTNLLHRKKTKYLKGTVLDISREPATLKYDFSGIWFTSQNKFIEVVGAGAVYQLDQYGGRSGPIDKVNNNGVTCLYGQLEQRKRGEETSFMYKGTTYRWPTTRKGV